MFLYTSEARLLVSTSSTVMFLINVPIINVPGKKGRKAALIAAIRQNKGAAANI